MARSLLDPGRAAASTSSPALQRRALVDLDLRDPHVLGHQLVIVLGVGCGGRDQLRDVPRRPATREVEQGARASGTVSPRTWSATRRALRGATRMYRVLARTTGLSGSRFSLSATSHRSALVPEWALKVRVGANSPSLCPTIDSEMNTGTCFRPS